MVGCSTLIFQLFSALKRLKAAKSYMEDRRGTGKTGMQSKEIFFFFFLYPVQFMFGFNLKLEFKVSSPCAAAAFLITGAGWMVLAYLIVWSLLDK